VRFNELEARVAYNSRAMWATLVGAAIGGFTGYLLFTDEGRELRRKLEPALDDFTHELHSFRHTVERAAGVASEGWKLLNEALGENAPPMRYSGPRQTSPF
jgi:gas vesicle protein